MDEVFVSVAEVPNLENTDPTSEENTGLMLVLLPMDSRVFVLCLSQLPSLLVGPSMHMLVSILTFFL